MSALLFQVEGPASEPPSHDAVSKLLHAVEMVCFVGGAAMVSASRPSPAPAATRRGRSFCGAVGLRCGLLNAGAAPALFPARDERRRAAPAWPRPRASP